MSYLRNKLKRILSGNFYPDKSYRKISYSQYGEDLIVAAILEELKIDKPIYLDIGAHHPFFYNNTYLFYKRGCRGVNIEPDPDLIEAFYEHRNRDSNLNNGIGIKADTVAANFYIMSVRTLNTFSKEDAFRHHQKGSYTIEKTIKIPLIPVNKILNKYFNGGYPNFVSIDAEGLDYEILLSFDFSKYRPEVLSIETLTFTEDNSEQKITNIIDYICANGYFVYADTYINTIFVDKITWQSRRK